MACLTPACLNTRQLLLVQGLWLLASAGEGTGHVLGSEHGWPCTDSAKGRNIFLPGSDSCNPLAQGLWVLQAPGEAEAMCAALDRAGHVDACATSDSDALLFAAQTQFHTMKPVVRLRGLTWRWELAAVLPVMFQTHTTDGTLRRSTYE